MEKMSRSPKFGSSKVACDSVPETAVDTNMENCENSEEEEETPVVACSKDSQQKDWETMSAEGRIKLNLYRDKWIGHTHAVNWTEKDLEYIEFVEENRHDVFVSQPRSLRSVNGW